MKRIILNSETTYDIVIESIDNDTMKKVNEAMNEKKDIDFLSCCGKDDVYCIGNTNNMSESVLQKYIPSKNNQSKNYMCYSKKDFGSDSMIVHDSATSAFYCVLEILGKPKYAVIYRKEKQITENDDTIIALGMNLVNQEKYNKPNIEKF